MSKRRWKSQTVVALALATLGWRIAPANRGWVGMGIDLAWSAPQRQEAEPPTKRVEILEPVLYSASDFRIERPSQGPWLALCPTGDRVELRAVRISVRKTHDPVVDDDSAKTGNTVIVGGCPRAILVIRGLSRGATKDVPTARIDQLPRELPKPSEIVFGGEQFRVDPVEKLIRSEDGVDYFSSHTFLTQGDRDDELFACEGCHTPPRSVEVKWAGDIDGDGRLDLVVSEDEADRKTTHLFLSSAAAPGKLIKEVATTRYGGC